MEQSEKLDRRSQTVQSFLERIERRKRGAKGVESVEVEEVGNRSREKNRVDIASNRRQTLTAIQSSS
jgi:carbon monoxide dehydrogenase subunit G